MTNRFRKNRENRVIAGVCAGFADQFSIDSLWIRIGFVALTLMGFGLPVLLYILIALLAPST